MTDINEDLPFEPPVIHLDPEPAPVPEPAED